MENENLKPIEKLTPFTKMIMTIGTLPSSFYASMSYYESMVWLYEYLKNQVIPTVNNNAEAVEELQTAFITLKTWIENYFENLDVQEEINNKLDEMAEDGTLTNLIKNYVDPLYQAYETEINGIIGNQNQTIANQTNVINTFINDSTEQIDEINNKVIAGTSGSPAGVYSSVSALQTADPDHSKIYVVTENGNWYYYNGSAWTSGGTYQATGEGEDFTQLKEDFYGGYIINEHDLLADKLGATLTSLDAQTTITASDDSPSNQINISNLTGDLSGASLDLGTLFNPIVDGTYYVNFKVKVKQNSASEYQTPAIFLYMYFDESLKGSKTGHPDGTKLNEWQDITVEFPLTSANTRFNIFHFYTSAKYDYEIKDIYITNNTDYNTGYFTQIDGVYKTSYKKISIIGDSITAVNDTASVKYTNLLHNNLGFNINNVAVSGSGYFNGSNQGGTNDHQFYNQALRCDNDSDLYLIVGGFNDISRLYGEYTTIGTLGDTGTSTIYGCIYNAFMNIYSLNPTAKIGVVLPAPWQGYNTLMANDNPYKVHVDAFINALIESCEHYCIPYLDLYHNSNMRPWNADVRTALYYQGDGVHPNNTGHAEYLYPPIKDFVKYFINYKYIN